MRRMICAAVLCCFLTLPSFAADTPKYLALTFDDGPSGRFTSRLLDGLAAREVHATFFLCGYRIEQYPELTARIAREGHEIGTHGYAHKFFNSLSAEGVCCDLSKAQRCIEEQPAFSRRSCAHPAESMIRRSCGKLSAPNCLSCCGRSIPRTGGGRTATRSRRISSARRKTAISF